jgi:hypothetical protein
MEERVFIGWARLSLCVGMVCGIGCGPKDDGSSGACVDLSGDWIMTEHCDDSEIGAAYSATQDGCDLTVESDQGPDVWDAHVDSEGAFTSTVTVDGTDYQCAGPATSVSIVWDCEALGCSGRLQRPD